MFWCLFFNFVNIYSERFITIFSVILQMQYFFSKGGYQFYSSMAKAKEKPCAFEAIKKIHSTVNNVNETIVVKTVVKT